MSDEKIPLRAIFIMDFFPQRDSVEYGEGHKGKAKTKNKTDEKGLRDWYFHPEVKMER